MKRREKKIEFYVAIEKADPTKFLCITNKKEEAIEYIIQHFKFLKMEHFKMWCNCRNLNINDDAAWFKYFNDVVTVEEKNEYQVNKIGYTHSNLSALLRMFSGCVPIGCSFDTPAEYQYFDNKLKSLDAVLNNPELKNGLEKALDDYKKIWE